MPGRIAVLGATGRLGRMLQRLWPSTGPDGPRFYGRRPAGRVPPEHCFDLLNDPPQSLGPCDALLVLAGAPQVSPETVADHARIARAAAQIARASGDAHLMLMSSAAIYGRAPGPLRETAAPTPASPYGEAKALLEQEAQAIARDQPVTVIRLGNVAGADAVLGPALTGKPMVLDEFPDGRTPCRSYIGPVTLSRALAHLAALRPAPGQPRVINLAQPGPVEMGALLDAAEIGWTARPAPATALADVVLDLDKISGLWPDLPTADPAQMIAECRETQR